MQKPLEIEETVRFATHRGILPARVRDCMYDFVLFTRASHENLEVISWDTFESILNRRNLQVFDCAGYLKIMRRHMEEATEFRDELTETASGSSQYEGSRHANSFVDSLDEELKQILNTSVSKNSEVLKALSK